MIDIVFLGTPDFAVPSLDALVSGGYHVSAVFTQPDRPKGRGNKLAFSPVKEYALSHGIPVYQPDKIRREENAALLASLKPDLMVTAAFGQILSAENLAVPRLGCVNVHASLLPLYRGSSPIQWTVINGETETGITTMYTDVGVDTGDVILQKKTAVGETETAGELFDRLALLGAETLLETVRMIENGTAPRTPQDHGKATHYPMLSRENARVDFSLSAKKIVDLVRGLNPWPVAWTEADGEVLKIYRASVTDRPASSAPGTIVAADAKNGLLVCAGDLVISLDEIQFPGKRAMDARSYFLGHSLKAEKL